MPAMSRLSGTACFLGRFMGGVALIAAGSPALAGGLDYSGQDVSALFETGNYAELSYGYVSPTVSGTFLGASSGDMAPSYSLAGAAIKSDFGPNLSAALIVDQPWGASAEYPASSYALTGTSAHVTSTGVTVMGRYKVSGNFSIDGGLRYITASGDFTQVVGGVPAYSSTYSPDSDVGYVVGAAYERPDIALRAAVTYSTATTYHLSGTVGDATAKMPQSVNFDFRTGVAANTLLMASARWANWKAASITDSVYSPVNGPLVSYNHDVVSYSLGLGHRFSPQLSTAINLGYEPASPGTVSDLEPTNGYTSLGIGASWTQNNVKIQGGVQQYWLGNATTSGLGGYFSGNTAIGAGLKVSFSF